MAGSFRFRLTDAAVHCSLKTTYLMFIYKRIIQEQNKIKKEWKKVWKNYYKYKVRTEIGDSRENFPEFLIEVKSKKNCN